MPHWHARNGWNDPGSSPAPGAVALVPALDLAHIRDAAPSVLGTVARAAASG
jgi:hypothetical protein